MAAAPAFSVIGRPIPRVEGRDKVSGAATYAVDVALAGMLWGRNVRSSLPHARIVSIDVSRARALPGVRAVLTAADLPRKRVGLAVTCACGLHASRARILAFGCNAETGESSPVSSKPPIGDILNDANERHMVSTSD